MGWRQKGDKIPSEPGKKAMDMILAGLSLSPAIALTLIPYMMIKLEDGGPAMVKLKNEWPKNNGDTGEIIVDKLRTMVVDADKKELALANGAPLSQLKNKHDPRVTRVGRWLRATSLDELPQIKGVFRKEWSLVGPRPLGRADLNYLRNTDPDGLTAFFEKLRVGIKPGITGFYGIFGRSKLSIEERLNLETIYLDEATLVGDMRIIAKTFGEVWRKRGAK